MYKGRRGFATIDDDAESIISSIYDEIEEAPRDGEGVKSDEEGDPARRIWRGIDEEYSSPEGGRFHRRRRARRQVSVRDVEERVLL